MTKTSLAPATRVAVCLIAAVGLFADGCGGARVRHPLAANPCWPQDAATAAHLHYLRVSSASAATGDSAWRTHTRVPLIADTTLVRAVTDPTLCAKALAAYNAIVLPDSAATEIELLRADTVYIADHPLVRSGEWTFAYVLGSAFQYLGSYAH